MPRQHSSWLRRHKGVAHCVSCNWVVYQLALDPTIASMTSRSRRSRKYQVHGIAKTIARNTPTMGTPFRHRSIARPVAAISPWMPGAFESVRSAGEQVRLNPDGFGGLSVRQRSSSTLKRVWRAESRTELRVTEEIPTTMPTIRAMVGFFIPREHMPTRWRAPSP